MTKAQSILLFRDLSCGNRTDLFCLPENCSIVEHDEQLKSIWLDIQQRSDKYNTFESNTFEKQFPDKELRKKRVFYLKHNDTIVGTAAVWFGGKGFPRTIGRLHWVAVLPEYQNRGLGRLLVNEAVKRFVEMGYFEIYLSTSTMRPNAVKLYLSEGFYYKPTAEFSEEDWERYCVTLESN